MEGYYSVARISWEEDNDFYEGNVEDIIELPEGFEKTIPTTARAVVDEAVDNIDPYDMIINYAPRRFSDKANKEAEEISRFLKNMWLYWRASAYDIDILRDFIKNLFKNGKAVFKILPDWTLWPTLSEKEERRLMGDPDALSKRAKQIIALRQENFPVLVRSIPPENIMEDPTLNSRKLWVIERYDGNSREIENLYAEYLPYMEDTQYGASPYTIHELWSASYIDADGMFHQGYHWTFVNNVRVEAEDNPFDALPFVIKYSGLGRETFDGSPEVKATGFFTAQVKSMLKAEMRRVAQFDALMSQTAFPIAFFPESVEEMDIDVTPGAVNYLPDEVFENKLDFFTTAQLPESAYLTSLNMIQNSIERGTTQRAIRGAGVPGTDSAAQLQMITAQAKLRLEPVKRATEEACDQVNYLVLKYVETIFEDDVSVFGAEPTGPDRYTVSPSQIKGRYRTRTVFMPSDEQTKERKLVIATDAMSKAGLNPYDAYTLAGFDNPVEMVERNLAWMAIQQPNVMRVIGKKLAEDWGLDTEAIILEGELDNMELTQFINAMKEQLGGTQMPQGDPMQQGQPQQQGGGALASPQGAGAPPASVQQLPETQSAQQMISGVA